MDHTREHRTPPLERAMGVGRQQQQVHHGILLHNLKDVGITGKRRIWFFQFPTNRTHYVRIPGGISKNITVLSSVPQGSPGTNAIPSSLNYGGINCWPCEEFSQIIAVLTESRNI